MSIPVNYERCALDAENAYFIGALPPCLLPNEAAFDELWKTHPADLATIKRYGKTISVKRWNQAYGCDYAFSGQTAEALPILPELRFFLAWAAATMDWRLNALLVNWYDGSLGHRIGLHRDEPKDLVMGAPIVMISLGSERVFGFTNPVTRKAHRFTLRPGSVLVLPYHTNLVWKHEVKEGKGRRISITLRAIKPSRRTRV